MKVAQIEDGRALIEDGLQAGERVVVDGQYKLQAGSKVEVSRDGPKRSAASRGRFGRHRRGQHRTAADRDGKRTRMNISEPFIRRPIATSLLMAAVIMLGLLGYKLLPISALPAVDFPTIQVFAQLPGASPDVMASSVTTPLERQFGQIPGLASMNSVSSFGNTTITLQFVLDREIDAAAEDVQAAINASDGVLPTGLPNPPTYSKVNPADTPILSLAITSDSLPLDKVNDFADTVLAQKLSQVTGVGLVSIRGQPEAGGAGADQSGGGGVARPEPGGRADHARAGQRQRAEGELRRHAPVDDHRLQRSDSRRCLVPPDHRRVPQRRAGAARAMVGSVIDSVENDQLAAWVADARTGYRPAVLLDIQRQPGANIIETVNRIKTLLAAVDGGDAALGEGRGAHRPHGDDPRLGRRRAVHPAADGGARGHGHFRVPAQALGDGDSRAWRCRLSIIGTFGLMKLCGFSLDNLSLMALTISTGFVVDDAIVMIENIVRFIEAGDPPFEAALKGARQIGFTVVSLSVSLIAVFIPLLFMTGIVGRLFREFAITLSAAVVVSAVISLTLTPMMCAYLLKPEAKEDATGKDRQRHNAFYRVTETLFRRDARLL